VLARGESIERSVTAAIPLVADLGDVAVTMIARSRSGERAVASAIVEVTDPLHSGRRPGPVVTLGAGSVMSAGLPSRSVESVAIDGPLTDAFSVSGRFSTPTPNDLVNGRALSSLGYNSQSNFLSMNAPNWGATLGTTGVSLGDLGGQNVFGRGGSLRIGAADEQLQFLAAAPLVAEGTWNRPTLIAAGAQRQLGSACSPRSSRTCAIRRTWCVAWTPAACCWRQAVGERVRVGRARQPLVQRRQRRRRRGRLQGAGRGRRSRVSRRPRTRRNARIRSGARRVHRRG
jgi:hypothetical protein